MAKSKKLIKHASLKKELLKEPEILKAYNELEEEYQLLKEMLHARKRRKLTQETVAKKMGTTPSVVSRLESVPTKNRHSPSIETVKRYAHAVGCKLSIKFVPKH